MKILITGIGASGKSALRRFFVKRLEKYYLIAQYDADRFKELRDLADIDCLEFLPDTFHENIIYVIEDIHGTLDSSVLPLKRYDLIFYLKPGFFSHLIFWLKRTAVWFQNGYFDWEPEKGWQGTGKAYDWHNLIPIARIVIENFRNRKKWISEDLKIISRFPCVLLRSRWTFKGIEFILTF